ncbi:MAG: Ig-like domain-containing protein [Dysgonamonadaceae bacterium]|nr:Ig-like domain-containing protein [Dysgonamonadaceae bacterium]
MAAVKKNIQILKNLKKKPKKKKNEEDTLKDQVEDEVAQTDEDAVDVDMSGTSGAAPGGEEVAPEITGLTQDSISEFSGAQILLGVLAIGGVAALASSSGGSSNSSNKSDTTPPAAGTLSFNNLTDSGSSNTDNITTDNTFDLTLTGNEAGSTVVYQVSTDDGATWNTTTASQSRLADESYQFRAIVTDAAGNSSTTNVLNVTVDNTNPTAGTLSFRNLTDSGSSSSDHITQDNTFDLTLTGNEAGSTVVYEVSTDDGATWNTTTASQSSLGDESYQFRAVVTDAAGNSSTTNVINVTVDNTNPAAGTLSFSNLDDTGSSNSDHITQDNTFDLTLTGNEAGSTVVYQVSTDDGATWNTTTANQSELADESYQFRAIVTDAAGNSSTTNVISVTVDNVDNTPPAAGTLSFSNLDDTGSDDTPDMTQDNTFDLTLTGNEAGSTVVYQVSTDDGATWNTTTASQSSLGDESYQFRAVVTDSAGNSSTTNVLNVTVDNTNPAAGTLSFSNLDDTGSDDTPDMTQDNTFDLTLTGNEAGSTVVYEVSTDDGSTWNTTTASQSSLGDESYQFRAVVTDAAGNSSTTNVINVTVDNTNPTAGTLSFSNLDDTGSSNSDHITQDYTFDLTLTGNEAGSTVVYQVSTDDGATWNTTTANQSELADESYQFRAVVTDSAGNSSTTNVINVTVDNTAPAAGTLSFNNLTDSGSSNTDNITTDDTFDLTLTGNEAGSTVVYEVSTDDGSTWNTTTASQSSLGDESYQFRAVVTDSAGNSSTTNVINVTVDNTNPTAGTLSFSNLTDSGSSNTDNITTDDTFDLTLTGNEAGSTVVYEVSTDDGSTWNTTTASQSSLGDESYQFRAVVTDSAGNSSTTNVINVTVDNTAPAATLAETEEIRLDGEGGDDFEPQITATNDGGFVVTWHGWGSDYLDIFVQKFDSNGDPSGSEIKLDGAGWWDADTQITSTADGGFVVTWRGYNGSNYDIFVQKFDSNGDLSGTEIQLDGDGYRDIYPQVTATGDGGFVVTWYEEDGDERDIFVQKFDSNGDPSGSEIKLDGAGDDDGSPQITATNDGGFAVTWLGGGDVFVQKFDSNGDLSGSEVRLDGTGYNDYDPQIAVTTDGGFVVTWYGKGSTFNNNIFVQKFDSSGALSGAEIELDGVGDHDYYPQIAATDDGGFVVTWQGDTGSSFDIFVQKFDGSGAISGSKFQFDGVAGTVDANPQITATDDGGFVVTWQGGGDIHVQKFDSSGDLNGPKFQLDGAGDDDGSPQITATNDGGFAVTWLGGGDVFVQKFDSNGSMVSAQSSEVGTAYLVNDMISVNDLASITSSADEMWNSFDIASADTPTALSTTGLAAGTYHLYAVDAAGNLSDMSSNSYSIL